MTHFAEVKLMPGWGHGVSYEFMGDDYFKPVHSTSTHPLLLVKTATETSVFAGEPLLKYSLKKLFSRSEERAFDQYDADVHTPVFWFLTREEHDKLMGMLDTKKFLFPLVYHIWRQ